MSEEVEGWERDESIPQCPHCGMPNNGWSSTDGNEVERPSAGAISLCVHCGELCVYTSTTSMRKATEMEKKELDSDPMVLRTRKILSYTDDPKLVASLLTMEH